MFIKSGISRGDWIKLCDLVDRQASGYINQTQLAYLLRMINQRRKGRRLPIMLPSDVVRAMTSGLPLSDIVEPALKPPGPSRSFGLESKDLLSLDDTPTRPSKPPSPAPARPRSPVGQSDSSQSDYRLLLRYVQAEKDTLESHVVALDRELKGIQGQIGVYRDEVLPAADQSLRLLESLGIKV